MDTLSKRHETSNIDCDAIINALISQFFGHVETTYGTDFDCVARAILAEEFTQAVIITDGFASMGELNQLALH